MADLLYALGWALWTGVVVVVFVEIVPQAKRRQIKRAIDAYEALINQSRAEQVQVSGGDEHHEDDRARGPVPCAVAATSHRRD